jgi:hypothetical protein
LGGDLRVVYDSSRTETLRPHHVIHNHKHVVSGEVDRVFHFGEKDKPACTHSSHTLLTRCA